MDVDTELPAKVGGKVLLYTSRDSAEPHMAFRRDVTPELPVVLQELSERYSPIKSMCFTVMSSFFLHHHLLEFNYHMYVREDNIWNGKGRVNKAVQDRDPVQWDSNDAGNMTLSILTVNITNLFDSFFSSSIRMLSLSLLVLHRRQLLPLPLALLLPLLILSPPPLLRSSPSWNFLLM
jgi:hypothetical protein